ncbi:DUF6531 domain-containing protein [Chondromyces crocatus]|uniref:Rhs family carbohydrate-binding protein n=1 Tax=Chondromyces crocatus TaxID=52 RepID=A0A0K1EIQ1_CHOCO|nr:DUF6531 domain-containing protein [Chondromyces crocatus]AKT40741.1 Rhs family carbohydrate-binding protein [Chondromyces crocatus]
MGTTVGNKDIATKGSGHTAVSTPAASLNPPTPPAGPVPIPYVYTARTATAKKTKKQLKAGGKQVVVKGSVMKVDPPANQPSLPTGGDIVTRAVRKKAPVIQGSSRTKAGGKPVSATGDMVRMNVPTDMMPVAQVTVPLIKAFGGGGAGGKKGKGAKGDKKGKFALPPQCAKKCTKAGHPVDVATGYVVDEAVDLALPGLIPILWHRSYSSARAGQRGALGRGGWVHAHEQWIELREGGAMLRMGDGRVAHFAGAESEEPSFHRGERLSLRMDRHGGFSVYDHETRRTSEFLPAARGGRALLRAIRDPYEHAVLFQYEGERLVGITDTAGREIRLSSDDKGRLIRMEVWAAPPAAPAQGAPPAPSLATWFDYAYHPTGELAVATNALGHADRYEYDSHHRMVKTTLKNGVSFHYEYDGDTGACVRTWGDGGLHEVELFFDRESGVTTTSGTNEARRYTWNADGLVLREETLDGQFALVRAYDDDQLLLSEANAAGQTTHFAYDVRGNRTKVLDPAGNETVWEYEDDLPTKRVGADGLVTTYAHDGHGALKGVTYPTGLTTSFAHDREGRLTGIFGPEGLLVDYGHDAHHNVAWERTARGAATHYTHDALGRPVGRADALGRRTRVDYDRLGQPVTVQYPDGTSSCSTYDPLGNVARFTDALGQSTAMEYRGTGVLAGLVQADGLAWRFRYDSDERLVEIENPHAELYRFVYDRAGRVVEEHTFDGRRLEYRYSKAGNLSRVDSPDGTFREFVHDPLGRLVEDRSPDGDIVFERDRLGRLLQAVLTEAPGKVVNVFERDRFGRLVAERQNGREIRFAIDERGRRAARVLPGGETTRYRHDLLGALAAVEHDGHVVTIDRDPLGREIRKHLHASGVDIQSSYDAMDHLAGQRVSAPEPGGGAPRVLAERRWHHDPLGRVSQIDDARWGSTRYGYDAVGQLVQAARGDRSEVFEYDVTGSLQNILSELGQAGRGAPWELRAGNVLTRTQEARFENDACGRRTRKVPQVREADGLLVDGAEATGYVWDCRDRLREVKLPDGRRVLFTYDAFGRRVRKEVLPAARGDYPRMVRLALEQGKEALPKAEVTEFLWDGDVLAAEIQPGRRVEAPPDHRTAAQRAADEFAGRRGPSPDQPWTRVFVHVPGSFVPLLQAEQGAVFTYVNDHLGTPKELIDPEGRVAWSAAHSAWGQVVEVWRDPKATPRHGGVESPFRLLGQYEDGETGLCYTRFRYFDAALGRWLSPDPLNVLGGMNACAWDGAPTCRTDPFGLSTFTPNDVSVLISDSNPQFPLTKTNAETVLGSGPAGSTAQVGGPGKAGGDVTFTDTTGQVVGKCEVKCIAGGAQGSFNREVGHAAKKQASNVFVQVPSGSDAERMVRRFRGSRPDRGSQYKNVTIIIADPNGNELYNGPLGCP